jgi:hypothetical protein
LVQGTTLNPYSETKPERDPRTSDVAKATAGFPAVRGTLFY